MKGTAARRTWNWRSLERGSGLRSCSERVGDSDDEVSEGSEGEVRQKVVGSGLGGSSGSSLESLD